MVVFATGRLDVEGGIPLSRLGVAEHRDYIGPNYLSWLGRFY